MKERRIERRRGEKREERSRRRETGDEGGRGGREGRQRGIKRGGGEIRQQERSGDSKESSSMEQRVGKGRMVEQGEEGTCKGPSLIASSPSFS